MERIMHSKAAFVFWMTLFLYLTTLFTVSYVGVHLTYIAIPMIVISGVIMLITKPSKKYTSTKQEVVNFTSELDKNISKGLGDVAQGLRIIREVQELRMERDKDLQSLKIEYKKQRFTVDERLDVNLTEEDKRKARLLREKIDSEIAKIEKEIDRINYECELEVRDRYN